MAIGDVHVQVWRNKEFGRHIRLVRFEEDSAPEFMDHTTQKRLPCPEEMIPLCVSYKKLTNGHELFYINVEDEKILYRFRELVSQ